jgi:hypothetical protein
MSQDKRILTILRHAYKSAEKEINKLKELKTRTRKAWEKGYQRYLDSSSYLAEIVQLKHSWRRLSKKATKARKIVDNWKSLSVEFTQEIREFEKEIRREEVTLHVLESDIKKIIDKLKIEDEMKDAMVDQVFELNDRVVEAMKLRNSYLTEQVFSKLFYENGKLRSQVTFDNSVGTRRVVALVNSITKLDFKKAQEAKALIESFFAKFKESLEMDAATRALFDLTNNLLVEKTEFKVGPDLYRFLSLEIEKEVFPELYQAQMLLRGSLRSEKTDSYVRLYVRKNRHSQWTPIKLK